MQKGLRSPSCMALLRVSLGAFLIVMGLTYVCAGTAVYAAGGAASFSLQPVLFDPASPITKAYFVFNVSSSSSLQNSVRLINIGNARGTVDLYPVDTTTGQYSGVSYLDRSKPRLDIASWIKLSLVRVTLGPGKSQNVPFHLVIPHTARVGQHVGGIVAENTTLQNSSSSNSKGVLTVKKMTIVPVVVNLPGSRVENLVTTGAKFDSANSFQRLLIPLSNTGNILLLPSGTLTITDAKGHVVQKNTLNLDALLPQTTIQYPINVRKKALSVGKYKARLQLTYGKYTKHAIDITSSFTIAKPGKPLVTLAATTGPQSTNNVFSQLSPWQYAVGGIVLLLTGSALFFWVQKLFMLLSFQLKSKGRRSTKMS